MKILFCKYSCLILITLVTTCIYSQQLPPSLPPVIGGDVCNDPGYANVLANWNASCSNETTTVLNLLNVYWDSPLLESYGGHLCSDACMKQVDLMRIYSACPKLFDDFAAIVPNASIRSEFFEAMDDRCYNASFAKPALFVLWNNETYNPCTDDRKEKITSLIMNISQNCLVSLSWNNPINGSSNNSMNGSSNNSCSKDCIVWITLLPSLLYECRDDYRFIDSIESLDFVKNFSQLVNNCLSADRISIVDDCSKFNDTLHIVAKSCPPGVCDANCLTNLYDYLCTIDRCIYLFQANNMTIPIPSDIFNNSVVNNSVIDYIKGIKKMCNISTRVVDFNISKDSTYFEIISVDPYLTGIPKMKIGFMANDSLQWVAERFDHLQDSNSSKSYRLTLKALHEFRPRPNAINDTDFNLYGFDMNLDVIAVSYNLTSNLSAIDLEPITDLGFFNIEQLIVNNSTIFNVDMDNVNNVSLLNGSGVGACLFRRIFRGGLQYSPTLFSKIEFSLITTNINNGFNDSIVIKPGTISFDLVLENYYRFNDTSIVLEFDIDTVIDEDPILEQIYVPQEPILNISVLQLQDITESRLSFKDSRIIRWMKQVYCDEGQVLFSRARIVKVNSTTPNLSNSTNTNSSGLTVSTNTSGIPNANNTNSSNSSGLPNATNTNSSNISPSAPIWLYKHKLYITFYKTGVQCKKLIWPATFEIGTPEDDIKVIVNNSIPTFSSTSSAQTESSVSNSLSTSSLQTESSVSNSLSTSSPQTESSVSNSLSTSSPQTETTVTTVTGLTTSTVVLTTTTTTTTTSNEVLTTTVTDTTTVPVQSFPIGGSVNDVGKLLLATIFLMVCLMI